MHPVAPAADHVLAGHEVHVVAPAMGLYVLAGHELKVVAAEKTVGLLLLLLLLPVADCGALLGVGSKW